MGKLKIYTFPDKVLSQASDPIERVEKELYGLADDMLETMYHAPGVGLAANQVGLLQRIIVIDTDFSLKDPDEENAVADADDDDDDDDTDGVGTGEVIDGQLIINRKPRIMINICLLLFSKLNPNPVLFLQHLWIPIVILPHSQISVITDHGFN